jgi:hypothetical protein
MTGCKYSQPLATPDFESLNVFPQDVNCRTECGPPLFGPFIEEVIRRARQERAAIIVSAFGRFAGWMRLRLRSRPSRSIYSDAHGA